MCFSSGCGDCRAYAWSWGPLGWMYPTEIHPLETRSCGLAVASFCNLLFSAVIAQTFLTMLCSLQVPTHTSPLTPISTPPPLGGPTTPCPILRTTATHPGPPFPHSLCSSLTPSLFFPHANPPHPALVQGMCDCCTSAVLIEYGWTASLSRGGTLSSVHVHISRSQLLAWLAANLRPKWVLNVEEEIAH